MRHDEPTKLSSTNAAQATPPHALPVTHAAVRQFYAQQEASHEASLQQWRAKWMGMGYARGSSFLLCIAALLAAVTNAAGVASLWWWLLAAAGLLFLGIAAFHETLTARIRRSRLELKIDRQALARLDRRLREIDTVSPELDSEFDAISKDLDLFGPQSLFKLLGTVKTPVGVNRLRDWICTGAEAEEVRRRQESVGALRQARDWRYRLQLLCEQLSASQKGPSDFVNWCRSPNWFEHGKWILWLSRTAGLVTVVGGLLSIFGVVPLSAIAPVVGVSILVNFFLSVFFAGSVHDTFNQISSRHQETTSYEGLFRLLKDCPAESSQLNEIRSRLFGSGDVLAAMKRLGLLVWLASLRRHGLLFLLYLFFQMVFFWDLHVLHLLERWKNRSGALAFHWFDDLGTWEVLTALATFAADHPEWNFPKVLPRSAGPMRITGKRVGHPLLAVASRVDNDFELGPEGTFLLVTGSNMSGKSTLLRSIGLNVTLAQLGSVVCAEEFSTPTVHVDTSMRISDSLADGVSFFMAELKRLKEIVDRSAALSGDHERGHLFLLDEILQGTNSRERQVAVAEVIKSLVDGKSIGAISTHDLELAGVESLKDICTVVHFSESFEMRDGREVMTFDYRMHPGMAPTTNALKLLEIVGLRPRTSRST